MRTIGRTLFCAAFAVALAASAGAAEQVTASIVIKNHTFSPKELSVPAGKRVVLTVDNQDDQPEEFESHSLKVEKVILGKSKGTVRFGPLKPGSYGFFGEFHEATAQGSVVAK